MSRFRPAFRPTPSVVAAWLILSLLAALMSWWAPIAGGLKLATPVLAASACLAFSLGIIAQAHYKRRHGEWMERPPNNRKARPAQPTSVAFCLLLTVSCIFLLAGADPKGPQIVPFIDKLLTVLVPDITLTTQPYPLAYSTVLAAFIGFQLGAVAYRAGRFQHAMRIRITLAAPQ